MLVVDDPSVSRAYLSGALAALPEVEVVAVDSGTEALRALSARGFSLVLCDYEMPDMSGLHVLRFVRTRHSALELPVLMTARDRERAARRHTPPHAPAAAASALRPSSRGAHGWIASEGPLDPRPARSQPRRLSRVSDPLCAQESR